MHAREQAHRYHVWHQQARITEAASAVAFWLIVSFGPAGLVAINVLGLVFDQHTIAVHLAALAEAAPGSFGNLLIAQFLVLGESTPGSWWMDVLLVLASLWTVSTAVAMLLRGLRRGFGLPMASFAVVRVAGGVVGLAAIVLLGAISFLLDTNSPSERGLGFLLATLVLFMLVLALYRLAVGRARPLRLLWPGALVAAVGLVAIQTLWEKIGQASPSLALTYGTVAGLIISILSVWTAAFVVLLGPYVARLLDPSDDEDHSR